MKKKIILTAIILFLVGAIVGSGLHFILNKEISSEIIISVIEGVFVGIMVSISYICLTIIMSISFKDKEKLNRTDKIFIIPLISIGAILWFSIVNLITIGREIIVPCWWMHVICIALVLLVIFKANHDAKEVAKRI